MDALNPSLLQASATSGPRPRPGPEMGVGMSLKELKSELRGLTQDELKATSAVELTQEGYGPLIVIRDDHAQPRCQNEKLPMNNGALLNMVEKLSAHYGQKADKKEVAFLKGGFNPPGYTQVTLQGTGLGLYFDTQTGDPMGKLTGSL